MSKFDCSVIGCTNRPTTGLNEEPFVGVWLCKKHHKQKRQAIRVNIENYEEDEELKKTILRRMNLEVKD